MDFNQFINQQSEKLQSSGFDNEVETYKPKNPVLRLGKIKDVNNNQINKESALVRVLPPVAGSNEFFKEFRTLGINYVKKDGSQKFSMLTLPEKVNSSVVDPYVNTWLKQGVQFSNFPNKPARRAYIHVIEYFNQNGQLVPNTDEQGNVIIQPMELSNTGLSQLIDRLKDRMLSPSPTATHSFISADDAFPINISKAKKGEKSWNVTVYPTVKLGALPQGWEQQLSDLDKLATPTEENNPNFVNWLINNVNNTEVSHDNFKFSRETNTLGEESSTQEQTQAPTQQSVEQQLPSNLGGQNNTQPNFNNVQQPTPQVPPQQNTQFGQGTPVQQAPQQQTSQQPTQQEQSNPFENFDANNIDDSQIPFNTNESTPEPPKQNQPKSVDDVLAGLDL
ncbi:phage protein [Staphylococcus phage MR003]|nr:phage protein [Staphylococcus phage MR003]